MNNSKSEIVKIESNISITKLLYFSLLRLLSFGCELVLYGIIIYLIFGGIIQITINFGDKFLIYLGILLINLAISKFFLKKNLLIQKYKFGPQVYCNFEQEFIKYNPFLYKISKLLIKTTFILVFSLGFIAYRLNLLYPII